MQVLVWLFNLQWLGNCRTLICWSSLVLNIYFKYYFEFDLLRLTIKYWEYLMVLYRISRWPLVAMGCRHSTCLWFLWNPKFCRNIISAGVTGLGMTKKIPVKHLKKFLSWRWACVLICWLLLDWRGSPWCTRAIAGVAALHRVFRSSWTSETVYRSYQFDSLDHTGRH